LKSSSNLKAWKVELGEGVALKGLGKSLHGKKVSEFSEGKLEKGQESTVEYYFHPF